MNLLALIKEFCLRVGITPPTQVVESQDDQYLQLVALLNELLDYLTLQNWVEFSREATFLTSPTESQGTLSNLASGFMWMHQGTFFDRTNGLPVNGPVSDAEWQNLQASGSSGASYSYRFRGQELFLTPAPASGTSMAFEYASNWSIQDYLGITFRQYFLADTDICLLPSAVLLAGLKWIWKRESGFRYAEDFALFEAMVATYFSKNGTKPELNMEGGMVQSPGIFIPSGNWSVP